MSSIKKKVSDKNPHVALYALEVTGHLHPTLSGPRPERSGWQRSGPTASPGQRQPSAGIRREGSLRRQQPMRAPPGGLQVMESVVKNCGQTVHDEVANKQTMEELKELLKVSAPQGRGPAEEAGVSPAASLSCSPCLLTCGRSSTRCGRCHEVSVGGPRTRPVSAGDVGAGGPSASRWTRRLGAGPGLICPPDTDTRDTH